jgi:hypothetical protein
MPKNAASKSSTPVNDSARPHVVGMFALGAWNRWIEFIHAEAGNRLASLAQVCPERIDIARAGEASGHGNDGNGFVARFARARADPLARNSRRATCRRARPPTPAAWVNERSR